MRRSIALGLGATIVLGGLTHAGAAAVWSYLAPGGFPIGHARFLAGRVLPAVVVLLGLAALHRRSAHAALASWTALWCAGAATALVLYSDGRMRIALGCVVPCGVLITTCLAVSIVDRSRWNRSAAVLALVGAAVGIAFPVAVRAPPASTTPLGGDPPSLTGDALEPGTKQLAEGIEVDTRTAVCRIVRHGIDVEIEPLLRFHSRSPDRGWTLFTQPRVRGADQTLTMTRAVPTESGIRLFAQGVAAHLLDVEQVAQDTLRLDSWSQLDEPEFAHQVSCASFRLSGLGEPRIEFSSSPERIVEVLPYDDPLGRPLRIATLMQDGVLRILEASNAEKGPFSVLTEGVLERTDALTLTLYDGDRPRVRITLHDFASQASTDLSPTAGWGLPQNEISFVHEEYETIPVEVHILATWAGTGVGRGFDTVGHAAGTYRNRIDVEILR